MKKNQEEKQYGFLQMPPEGLFKRIEKDDNSKYFKLKRDYTYGLDKIYDRAFIERKKLDADFEREYNLKYLVGRSGIYFRQSLFTVVSN